MKKSTEKVLIVGILLSAVVALWAKQAEQPRLPPEAG
jgi:hypothetical protein